MLKKLSILALPLVLALSAMMIFGTVNMHATAQQNQTSSQGQQNQTSSQKSGGSQKIPLTMDEKLLNYTNQAIKASKSKDSKKLTSSLQTLQSALINASGKQAIFLPDTTTSGSGSSSGSSGSGSSGSSSGSGSSGTHHHSSSK